MNGVGEASRAVSTRRQKVIGTERTSKPGCLKGAPPRRTAHSRTRDPWRGTLTCCAALSASSANSTDRPLSACLREPHVLRCRAAQGGRGVVSEPKALQEQSTRSPTCLFPRTLGRGLRVLEGLVGMFGSRWESRKSLLLPRLATGTQYCCVLGTWGPY